MSGLATRRQKVKLLPLSLWVCLQNLGIEGVTQRINYALLLVSFVVSLILCSIQVVLATVEGWNVGFFKI